MNIAVNTRLLLKGKMEGIGWYAYEVLKRITTNHKEYQFYFLFDRKFDPEFIFSENITPVVLPPQARHPVLYTWWFERSVPKWIKKNPVNLLFSPEGYLSLRSDTPSVNVIHDLNFEHIPEFLNKSELKFYRKNFPEYARKAREIITVSKYSKNDLVKTYGIREQKINVIYNGIRDTFHPIRENQKSKLREEHAMGKPYFIYLGSIHPRKNVGMLLRAFDAFCSKADEEYHLVIAGRRFKKSNEVYSTYEKLKYKSRIKFLDYVEESDINNLLASAMALIYVPLFEGFGLPVLEAYQCGIPVVSSNVTSLPEVAGSAAILVNPESESEIAGAMMKVTTDKNKVDSMVEEGIGHAKKFSWDRCAEETWKVLERNLG